MSSHKEIPKSFDIYLNYVCPKCGAIHEATPKETKFPGGVLCYCGREISYKPIENVKINLVFSKTTKTRPKSSTPSKSITDESKLAISGLIKLGYKKSVAMEMVKGISGTAEEILETVLKNN